MTDSVSSSSFGIPFSLVVGTGITTLLLASALAYVLSSSSSSSSSSSKKDNTESTRTSETSSAAAAAANGKETVLDRAKYPGGNLYIYYATQTGTAESFGRQLEREAATHGFYAHVTDVESITELSLVSSPCVILSATYGEGEPTDNARIVVDLLKEAAQFSSVLEVPTNDNDDTTTTPPEQVFQQIQYCVFGLGNKQYDHYNAMGKFFHRAFQTLGATPLMEIGLGDDDNDLEGDFETWKDNQLWPTLKKQTFFDTSAAAAATTTHKSKPMELPETPFVVEYVVGDTNGTHTTATTDTIHPSSRPYFDAVSVPVTCVRELRSKQAQGSTVHVEVDISASPKSIHYQTADNLGVLPVNSMEHVEATAKCLGYDLDAVFQVKPAPGKEWHGMPFPMPLSIRDFLWQYCDLTGAPRRSELKLMSLYATDAVDQQFLQRLAAAEHKKEYQSKILDQYYGLVHLLQKCPSLKIPLEHFIDVCPRLQPRFFTIASSNQVHPKSIHLTVAVAQAQRPADQSIFKGVCSSYLAAQQQQQQQQSVIRVFVRPSTFRLPDDPSKPILLIGPGTGIAPMRALLQERDYQKHVQKLPVGPTILYFGCQRATHDYLYQDELKAFEAKKTLTALHLAFSREQVNQKVYVQHLLQQQAQETARYMQEQHGGAYIYVCGGVQMGHDVQETLLTILVQQSVVSNPTEAKEYLDRLAKQGRYVQELWA